MKQPKVVVLIAFTFLLTASLVQGQTSQTAPTLTSVLANQVKILEKEFVPAAEAMPTDKFNFVPSPSLGEFKESRTFAQEVSHVATANWQFGAAILGEKPPVDTAGPNENGPASLKTKQEIMKYLTVSFAYVDKAIATITSANAVEPISFGNGKSTRLGVASLTAWHGFDHYGQMVIYLRMNGIVPPASRPQPKK